MSRTRRSNTERAGGGAGAREAGAGAREVEGLWATKPAEPVGPRRLRTQTNGASGACGRRTPGAESVRGLAAGERP